MPFCIACGLLIGQCVIKCKQEEVLIDLRDKQIALLVGNVQQCDLVLPYFPTGGGSLMSATMAQRNKMVSQPAGIEEKEMDSFLNDLNAAGESSRLSCCCCVSFVFGCFCGYAAASLSSFLPKAKAVCEEHNRRLEKRGCGARFGFGSIKLMDGGCLCCVPNVWAVTIRYPDGIVPPGMFGFAAMQRQPGGAPPSSVPMAQFGTPPLGTATATPVAATAPPPYSTSMEGQPATAAAPPNAFCTKCGNARTDPTAAFCGKCGSHY